GDFISSSEPTFKATVVSILLHYEYTENGSSIEEEYYWRDYIIPPAEISDEPWDMSDRTQDLPSFYWNWGESNYRETYSMLGLTYIDIEQNTKEKVLQVENDVVEIKEQVKDVEQSLEVALRETNSNIDSISERVSANSNSINILKEDIKNLKPTGTEEFYTPTPEYFGETGLNKSVASGVVVKAVNGEIYMFPTTSGKNAYILRGDNFEVLENIFEVNTTVGKAFNYEGYTFLCTSKGIMYISANSDQKSNIFKTNITDSFSLGYAFDTRIVIRPSDNRLFILKGNQATTTPAYVAHAIISPSIAPVFEKSSLPTGHYSTNAIAIDPISNYIYIAGTGLYYIAQGSTSIVRDQSPESLLVTGMFVKNNYLYRTVRNGNLERTILTNGMTGEWEGVQTLSDVSYPRLFLYKDTSGNLVVIAQGQSSGNKMYIMRYGDEVFSEFTYFSRIDYNGLIQQSETEVFASTPEGIFLSKNGEDFTKVLDGVYTGGALNDNYPIYGGTNLYASSIIDYYFVLDKHFQWKKMKSN
ncbi:hypothetical protein LJC16_03520, partial [Bacteroidales bacterium OttesenSCG-928-C19]|nr:hypothetical protein [Bacteroidales bacterium OttesenSCG-928-C19]